MKKDSLSAFLDKYVAGGPTTAKAKEMLRDGSVHGHPLTDKQKRYFGWIAGGRKQDGGPLDQYQGTEQSQTGKGYYVSNTPYVEGTDWSEGSVPANYWTGTYSGGSRNLAKALSYQDWLKQQKGYTDLEKQEGVTLPVINISTDAPGYVESVGNEMGEALNPTTSMFYNPMSPQLAMTTSLLSGGLEALAIPQKSIVYGLTGEYARPSEVSPTRGLGNVNNTATDLTIDLLTDPLMYPHLLGKGVQTTLGMLGSAGKQSKNLALSAMLARRMNTANPKFDVFTPKRLKKVDPINRSTVNVQSDIRNTMTPEEYDYFLQTLYDNYRDAFDNPLVEFKGAKPTSMFTQLQFGDDAQAMLLKEKFCAPGSACAKTANAVTSRTYTDITGRPFDVNANAHNAWHMEEQMRRHGAENVTNEFLKVGDRVLMGNAVDQSTYVPGFTADPTVRHAGMYAGLRDVDGTLIPVLFESGASNALHINPVAHTFTGPNTVRQVVRPFEFIGDDFGKALTDKNIRYAFRDKPAVATYSSNNPTVQNILNDAENHRETIKKTYDITNDEFNELLNGLIGIGAQETKLSGELAGSTASKAKIKVQDALVDLGLTKPIKQTLNIIKKGLNATSSTASASTLPKFPGLATVEMEAAILSKESGIPLDEAIQQVFARYQPKPKYTLSTPEASKGMFRQKFQTSTDRLSGVSNDIVENSVVNGLGLMAENYNKVKKLYPNASPRQLMDLTVLMWNSPGKAANPNLVDFYLFGKNNPNPERFKFDYIDKVNRYRDDLINVHPQSVEPYYEIFRNAKHPEIQYKAGGSLTDKQKEYFGWVFE
jgi:hypothetical protein